MSNHKHQTSHSYSRAHDWECPTCRVNVFGYKDHCFKCGYRNEALINDWWCAVCKFRVFATKDACRKCGMRKTQILCCCGEIYESELRRCPKCDQFASKSSQYVWLKEHGQSVELQAFLNANPEYKSCGGKCGDIPLIHCWKHS